MSNELSTPRLRLRPPVTEDFEAIYAIDGDPAVGALRTGLPVTRPAAREWLDRVLAEPLSQPRRRYTFVMAERSSANVIGLCGLGITNVQMPEAEVWYRLARRVWGLGLTPEAVRAVFGFGFGALHLHRIFAGCHPDNAASRRVMEKTGMTYEGRIRANFQTNGAWRDSLQYSILAGEFEAEKPQ